MSKTAALVIRAPPVLDPVLARLAPPLGRSINHLDLMAAVRKLALVAIGAITAGLDEAST